MKRITTTRFAGIFGIVLLASCMGVTAGAEQAVLTQTPPMGWDSWNRYGTNVSDAIVRAQADAMVSSGMKALGYHYLIIDDGWQGKRDQEGVLHPNDKFPDMKQLADYVHGKGLKLGIYSSPGSKTCAGFTGSLDHEEQDARTFAAWGIDYLKYDWCSGQGDVKAAYAKMHDALQHAGRPIVYSVCEDGMDRVWTWGASVGANLWRTGVDIADNYDRMSVIGFSQNGLARFAAPGHWNDPDMLEVGNGGMNTDEYRTQMSLWCLLAAPLIASNDLSKMTQDAAAILTNPEVIAVDQDAAGAQGYRVTQEGPLEVWMKPLANGGKAIGLFNRTAHGVPITVHFRDVELPDIVSVRDLWARRDLGTFRDSFTANVNGHGVVLVEARGYVAAGAAPTVTPQSGLPDKPH